MKKIALLLCAIAMFSCSDEEEKAWTEVEIPAPKISKMLVSEYCKSDGRGCLTLLKKKSFTIKMPG